jgi:hypothetical protein
MKTREEIVRRYRKPDTQRVMNYLWARRYRRVPSSELLRNLRMADYRARVSEIRAYLKLDGIARVESARIPKRSINYYRIVQAERRII